MGDLYSGSLAHSQLGGSGVLGVCKELWVKQRGQHWVLVGEGFCWGERFSWIACQFGWPDSHPPSESGPRPLRGLCLLGLLLDGGGMPEWSFPRATADHLSAQCSCFPLCRVSSLDGWDFTRSPDEHMCSICLSIHAYVYVHCAHA